MQTTKPVAALAPGDFIVKIGKREIGASFVETRPVPVGAKIRGPRGGKYEVLRADAYLVLVTAGRTAANRIVQTGSFATVETPEEI